MHAKKKCTVSVARSCQKGNFLNRSRSLSFSTFMFVSQKNPFCFLVRLSEECLVVCMYASMVACLIVCVYISLKARAKRNVREKAAYFISMRYFQSPVNLINYRLTLCEISSSASVNKMEPMLAKILHYYGSI